MDIYTKFIFCKIVFKIVLLLIKLLKVEQVVILITIFREREVE